MARFTCSPAGTGSRGRHSPRLCPWNPSRSRTHPTSNEQISLGAAGILLLVKMEVCCVAISQA